MEALPDLRNASSGRESPRVSPSPLSRPSIFTISPAMRESFARRQSIGDSMEHHDVRGNTATHRPKAAAQQSRHSARSAAPSCKAHAAPTQSTPPRARSPPAPPAANSAPFPRHRTLPHHFFARAYSAEAHESSRSDCEKLRRAPFARAAYLAQVLACTERSGSGTCGLSPPALLDHSR